LRPVLGGSAARSHGATPAAATNTYRIAPMASTHVPNEGATYTLSTRMKKASTSMSKRAPRADAVPVRLAT
jgi:hypothetical protein